MGDEISASLESGKKSLSEEHSNLGWLGYTRFVLIGAGKIRGEHVSSEVAPVEETYLLEKPNHKNYCQFSLISSRSALEETDLYLCVNGL